MKRLTSIATATFFMLLVALTLRVDAQQPDTRDRTIMTFSGAVELPGMRLEAGTYVFRLADTASRNVIQVLSADEMNMLGQWLFIPAQRQEVSGDTVVTFRETIANATPAVQYWYYPGEKIGKEFIYPKDQALRIAQRTGGTVLTEEGPVSAGAQASAEIAPAQEQGAVAVERQGAGVVSGSGLPDTPDQAVATGGRAEQSDGRAEQTAAAPAQTDTRSNVQQESTAARNESAAQDELPRTASPLGLAGLIALLSLAGAAGFRAFRR